MDALEPVAAGVAVDRRAPVKSSRSTVATLADVEPYFSALFTREARARLPRLRRGGRAHATPLRPRHAVAVASTRARRPSSPSRCASPTPTSFLEVRARLLEGRLPPAARAAARCATLESCGPARPRTRRASRRGGGGPGEARRTRELAARRRSAWRRRGRAGTADARLWHPAGAAPRGASRGASCARRARGASSPRGRASSATSRRWAPAPTCRGFGRTIGIDWDKVIPDATLSLARAAHPAVAGRSASGSAGMLAPLREDARASPWTCRGASSRPEQREAVLEGEGDLSTAAATPGVRAWFRWLETRTYKMHVRVLLSRYRAYTLCERVRRRAPQRATRSRYRVGGLDLAAWHAAGAVATRARASRRCATAHRAGRARAARAGSAARATWSAWASATSRSTGRRARSPAARRSGCRSPRRSARRSPARSSCSTSPRSGLHPTRRAAAHRRHARARARAATRCSSSSTTRASSARCDRVLELGPGAGPHGGKLVLRRHARGARAERPTCPPAGCSARRATTRRAAARDRARASTSRGAASQQPRRTSTCACRSACSCAITGPSGSGKSTLVEEIAVPHAGARARARRTSRRRARSTRVEGAGGRSSRVVLVDQAPLGRTSRGNAATYTKAWDRVRAALRRRAGGASVRGLTPGALLLQRRRRAAARRARARATRRWRCSSSPTWRSSARSAGASASSPRCSRSGTDGPLGRRRAGDHRGRGARASSRDDAAHRRRALGPLQRARPRATCRSASRCPRSRAARRSG